MLVLMVAITAFAAGEVDTTFNPILKRNMPNQLGEKVAIQPDGKILVWGYYEEISGGTKFYYLRRLNTNGTEDTTFNPNHSLTFIDSVMVQPDGKILVGGSSSFRTSKIIRLNADGSLDSSFDYSFTVGGNSTSCHGEVYAIRTDGKVYGSRICSGSELLMRFNSDGVIDSTFTSLSFSSPFPNRLKKLVSLPDGKVIIGGTHNFGVLFRVNQDGTKDTTFESPILSGANNPTLESFILKPDGKIVFSGLFSTVNGLARPLICRLNSDGSVDTAYTGVLGHNFSQAELLSNGKYIATANSVIRFNADDTQDTTYAQTGAVNSFVIDSQDRVVTPHFRLNYDGSLDTSFNRTPFLLNGSVSLLARQTDGKILVVGNFTSANSTSRTRFGRFNSDGTTDTTFNTGTGFDNDPKTIAFQTDGKILVGGIISSFNGNPIASLVRLNIDGSLDTTFNPALNGYVNSFVPLSTGKVLIGGNFSAFNGTARPWLARLNSDGTLDSSFNASLGGGTEVYTILAQTDGKYLISGNFSSVGGFSRTNYARLNNDGTIDSSFNIGNGMAGTTVIVQQPDGKYIYRANDSITGNFRLVKRLNSDGSNDSTFQTATFGNSISAIHLQFDGFIVVGGDFGVANNITKNNLARLKPDGRLDIRYGFVGANARVNTIIGQPDGKIIIGGNFSSIENNARTGLVRINVIPFTSYIAPFDFEGDGKSDFSVVRPLNYNWYSLYSSNYSVLQSLFGASGDILAPADYNFDGKCDIAIFRPSSGQWWYQAPSGQHTLAAVWGQAGDKPIPSDWDGDGKSDFIVFRPNNGVWYRLSSATGQMSFIQFGIAEDIPLQADYDGDGKSDVSVYRPSTGTWYWLNSSNGQFAGVQFGAVGDKPQTGDYDGDGKTDFAVFRPSNGYWYFLYSSSGYSFGAFPFGVNGDIPTVADYDGDGKTDIAVYRTNTWYVQRSTQGFTNWQFGSAGDNPIPSAYYP